MILENYSHTLCLLVTDWRDDMKLSFGGDFNNFLSIKHGLINLNYCFEVTEITESYTYTILFKMSVANLFCLYKQILASG